MNETNLKSAIESILFVSGEPIKMSKIAKICGISKEETVKIIADLGDDYQKNDRGLIIITKDDLVQMGTSPKNARFVEEMVKDEMSSGLSGAGSEVLSIIAYKGPISRIQIEAIRGVNCSYTLRNLLVKGLVERKESQGIRGYLYEISFDFLKSLGLSSVKQLPDWEKLSKDEKIEVALSENDAAPVPEQSLPEASDNSSEN